MQDQAEIIKIIRRLRWPIRLTQLGMLAQRLALAFWPLATLLLLALSLAMLGLQDQLKLQQVGGLAVMFCIALLAGLHYGVRQFRWPSRDEAQLQLDQSLSGRPIQTLLDQPAIGTADAASAALWQEHVRRTVVQLKVVRPFVVTLRLSRHDPFALRYAAMLLFGMALMFGSVWRVGSVTTVISSPAVATGPIWEGWVEPPSYTQLPALYLNDLTVDSFSVPRNSQVTLRLYGELGALWVQQTVSSDASDFSEASRRETASMTATFRITSSGRIGIEGEGGRSWAVQMTEDKPPFVELPKAPEVTALGVMSMPFQARDDYGVQAGHAVIALDWDRLDRRFGLRVLPEPRADIELDLALPITGDRRDINDFLVADFSQHPWANLPVLMTATVRDLARQTGQTASVEMRLPGRRFFDPLAAAMIELRRDLLWSTENATLVTQMLRAISHQPEAVFRSEKAYLRLRSLLHRLETLARSSTPALDGLQRDEIAEGLWALAMLIEEGDLSDALERLRRAQDRLSEATKNGASDAEIAELMQELRDASEAYMRQLNRQRAQDGTLSQPPSESDLNLSQNDFQRMMDRIQELMEQGRMAEAKEALDALRQMMENMQVARGRGQGEGSQGQQALKGLTDTLRGQQGLSDEVFRDLQSQTNPPDGQGALQPESASPGVGNTEQGEITKKSLADRQQILRRNLQRQQQALPEGSAGAEAMREALKRADEAMQGAEDALRSNDLAKAIDEQAHALEALRNGLQALGQAEDRDTDTNRGADGTGTVQDGQQGTDPLGRRVGKRGQVGNEDNFLNGENASRRARDLLEEIRRRTGESKRSDIERNYLQRLLERF